MVRPVPPTVAELIVSARRRAALSQAELGRRAGVAQSVVSAYENGHRRPSLEMAARLVSAAGARLVLDVVSPDDPDDAPVSVLGRRVRDLRSQVLAVASRYGASNVRLFGSVARGQDGERSDVDLLVDLRPGTGLFALLALQADLSALLDVRVDVVPAADLRASLREDVLAEAVPL